MELRQVESNKFDIIFGNGYAFFRERDVVLRSFSASIEKIMYVSYFIATILRWSIVYWNLLFPR
ncbi:hypothetical protein SZ63_07510 [Methanoculleus sediminis]|uniref:Uncharacterized protein n=1 Tax=Methanoculleus sediminis TaxID=1550566 RepID=A0A0H1R0W2_9EURY|nr:hypothetical protein SZ63_07510 [Methanoculleus sediminis]